MVAQAEPKTECKTGLIECKQSIAGYVLMSSNNPKNLLAFTEDRLKEDLMRRLFSVIEDGRSYTVRYFPMKEIESRWEGNPNSTYAIRALVTLRCSRDCQIGDLILDADLCPAPDPRHDRYVVADGEFRLLFARGGLQAKDVWQRVE